MNFETELSAQQSLIFMSDVCESYIKSDNITKKCGKKECMNNVAIHKDNYEYVSKIMLTTACGYRNKSSNFILYHFCSEECKEHFRKYSCCYKCNEDCTSYSKGTFVENLGYTLCNGRGDMEPPCISTITSYKLEKRYIKNVLFCYFIIK